MMNANIQCLIVRSEDTRYSTILLLKEISPLQHTGYLGMASIFRQQEITYFLPKNNHCGKCDISTCSEHQLSYTVFHNAGFMIFSEFSDVLQRKSIGLCTTPILYNVHIGNLTFLPVLNSHDSYNNYHEHKYII